MFTIAAGIILGFLGIVVIVRAYHRHLRRKIEREIKAFEKDEADGKHTIEWAVKETFGIPYPYEAPAPTKGEGVYEAMCKAAGRKVSRVLYWRFLWAMVTRSERRLEAWGQAVNEDQAKAEARAKAQPSEPSSVGGILVIMLFFGGLAFLITLLVLTYL